MGPRSVERGNEVAKCCRTVNRTGPSMGPRSSSAETAHPELFNFQRTKGLFARGQQFLPAATTPSTSPTRKTLEIQTFLRFERSWPFLRHLALEPINVFQNLYNVAPHHR